MGAGLGARALFEEQSCFPVTVCAHNHGDVMRKAMGLEENKQVVRRFIEEAINKGNVDAAGDYMAEDVVELVPFPGQRPGLSGLKDVLRGLRVAFPDMHWTIEEQIAEADKVLTRFVWTGTHKAAFFGVAATGKPVMVWGMVIDRLEHGKVKETRILMDALGLMKQMGA
jgi:steroid delta-isomerase-like uncharacterized protein